MGKLVDVDWHSLFASFFAMVRIKVKCRDPVKIPPKRLMELNDLFIIHFKTENHVQVVGKSGKEEGGDGGDDDGNLDDDSVPGEEDRDKGHGGESPKSSEPPDPNPNSQENGHATKENLDKQGHSSGGKTVRNLSQLFALEFLDKEANSKDMESSCINLLRAMEIEDRDEVDDAVTDFITNNEEEDLSLPGEWLFDCTGTEHQDPQPSGVEDIPTSEAVPMGVDAEVKKSEALQEVVEGGKKPRVKKCTWGLVLLEKKSKRVSQDGATMLSRAQALKRKNNLEIEKGKNVTKPISSSSLLDIASVIGIAVPAVELDKRELVKQMLSAEVDRNKSFNTSCNIEGCVVKADLIPSLVSEGDNSHLFVGSSSSLAKDKLPEGDVFLHEIHSSSRGNSQLSVGSFSSSAKDKLPEGDVFYEIPSFSNLGTQEEDPVTQ